MTWIRRVLAAVGLRRKTAEDVAADSAARQLFFDEKAGVVDERKNR